LRLDVMIGPTSGENWLTFGVVLIPDIDFGSLSISLTVAE